MLILSSICQNHYSLTTYLIPWILSLAFVRNRVYCSRRYPRFYRFFIPTSTFLHIETLTRSLISWRIQQPWPLVDKLLALEIQQRVISILLSRKPVFAKPHRDPLDDASATPNSFAQLRTIHSNLVPYRFEESHLAIRLSRPWNLQTRTTTILL